MRMDSENTTADATVASSERTLNQPTNDVHDKITENTAILTTQPIHADGNDDTVQRIVNDSLPHAQTTPAEITTPSDRKEPDALLEVPTIASAAISASAFNKDEVTIATLTAQLASERARRVRLNETLLQLRGKVREEIERLEEELAAGATREAGLRERLELALEETAVTTAILHQREEQVTTLQREVQHIAFQRDCLQGDLDEAVSEARELRDDLADAREHIADLEQKVNAMRKMNALESGASTLMSGVHRQALQEDRGEYGDDEQNIRDTHQMDDKLQSRQEFDTSKTSDRKVETEEQNTSTTVHYQDIQTEEGSERRKRMDSNDRNEEIGIQGNSDMRMTKPPSTPATESTHELTETTQQISSSSPVLQLTVQAQKIPELLSTKSPQPSIDHLPQPTTSDTPSAIPHSIIFSHDGMSLSMPQAILEHDLEAARAAAASARAESTARALECSHAKAALESVLRQAKEAMERVTLLETEAQQAHAVASGLTIAVDGLQHQLRSEQQRRVMAEADLAAARGFGQRLLEARDALTEQVQKLTAQMAVTQKLENSVASSEPDGIQGNPVDGRKMMNGEYAHPAVFDERMMSDKKSELPEMGQDVGQRKNKAESVPLTTQRVHEWISMGQGETKSVSSALDIYELSRRYLAQATERV